MRALLVFALLLLTGCPEKKAAVEPAPVKQVQPVVSDGVVDGPKTGNPSPVIDCKKACTRVHECEPTEPFDECVETCESIGAGLECAAAAKNCEEYQKCQP